ILSDHTAPPLDYTLSLHDALPIYAADEVAPDTRLIGEKRLVHRRVVEPGHRAAVEPERTRGEHQIGSLQRGVAEGTLLAPRLVRSEEHTSELQSRENIVCRLLLEK